MVEMSFIFTGNYISEHEELNTVSKPARQWMKQ